VAKKCVHFAIIYQVPYSKDDLRLNFFYTLSKKKVKFYYFSVKFHCFFRVSRESLEKGSNFTLTYGEFLLERSSEMARIYALKSCLQSKEG